MDGGDVDPIVAGAVVRAGQAGAKMADSVASETGGLLSRLFGPSADVIGANWAERLRERNLHRLLSKTEKHNTGDGYASPRVASHVFGAAEYADSEVVAEYLSGVLASSRGDDGQDDAGVQWSAIVARLSSAQLRLHYLMYGSIRPSVVADPPERANDLHNRKMVFALEDLLEAVDGRGAAFADALNGLMREGLVGDGYSYGPTGQVFREQKTTHQITFSSPTAVRVAFSIHGMRLFLWGSGAGSLDPEAYLDPGVQFDPAEPDTMPTLVTPAGFLEEFIVPLEPTIPVFSVPEIEDPEAPSA